jgi:hypothetical protein
MQAHEKAASAWGGVAVAKMLDALGVHGWGDAAAMVATVYSLILIGEWMWKKTKPWRT